MHIIIGVLTALAGLVWALHSLQNSGVDLNSFNPFTWARRRKWEKTYGMKPLYNIQSSMDAAAVLIVAVLKQEGEISKEQKQFVLKLFEDEFDITASEASELLVSSSFMIKDELDIEQSVSKILEPSKKNFTGIQVASLLDMLGKVSLIEGNPNDAQRKLIKVVEGEFAKVMKKESRWNQS